MASSTPSVRSTNSSIVTCIQRPTSSTKTLLHRQLFKKTSTLPLPRTPTHSSKSTARFQRIKGTNFVREVNPVPECIFRPDLINNYVMTPFDDDTKIKLPHRRAKKIPQWARKSQFQLALINQIYFNDKKPEDIFGSVQMDAVHEMVQSIHLRNLHLQRDYSYSLLPPNFV